MDSQKNQEFPVEIKNHKTLKGYGLYSKKRFAEGERLYVFGRFYLKKKAKKFL